MKEVINCTNEENIISSLKSGKRIVVVTENNLKVDVKAKIYENFKHVYSFKGNLTVIKLSEDRKVDKLTESILLILLKTAKRQGVDYIYMPEEYKKILNSPQFDKYQNLIKIRN